MQKVRCVVEIEHVGIILLYALTYKVLPIALLK